VVDVKIGNNSVKGFPLEFERQSLEAELAAAVVERQRYQDQVEQEEYEALVQARVAEKKAAALKASATTPRADATTPRADTVDAKAPAAVKQMFEAKPPVPVAAKPEPSIPRSGSKISAYQQNLQAAKQPEPPRDAARPAPQKNKMASMWEQKVQSEKK